MVEIKVNLDKKSLELAEKALPKGYSLDDFVSTLIKKYIQDAKRLKAEYSVEQNIEKFTGQLLRRLNELEQENTILKKELAKQSETKRNLERELEFQKTVANSSMASIRTTMEAFNKFVPSLMKLALENQKKNVQLYEQQATIDVMSDALENTKKKLENLLPMEEREKMFESFVESLKALQALERSAKSEMVGSKTKTEE